MSCIINHTPMAANFRCRYSNTVPPAPSVEARIAAFLDGTTNGEDLLHALYDYVLDEPIPQSLRTALKERQIRAG